MTGSNEVEGTKCDLLVAVCTSNRADSLGGLLSSLRDLDQAPCHWVLLVIDNPPAAETKAVVDRARDALSGPISVEYLAAETQGLPNARNIALRQALARNARAVVFIDDDETVSTDWLQQLWARHLEVPDEVVFGPARTVLADNAPEWVERSGLAHRAEFETGTRHPHCPTNNTLVPTSVLGDTWFDPAFNATGGSDTDFFTRLVSKGAVISYCREAVVYEAWDLDRASASYLRERAHRWGRLFARVTIEQRGAIGRLRVAISAVSNLAVAVPLLTAGTIKGDVALKERGAAKVAGARGKLGALIGATVPGKSDWSWT